MTLLSSLGSKIREFMSIPVDQPELLKAQFRALSQQLPMMYLILMTSTWAVALTHMPYAPGWLTIAVPTIMTAISGFRLALWARARRIEPTADKARRALNQTNRLSVFIALGFTSWSLMLYPYGDAYTKSHLAFYMAITVISCIFCLTHLRPAAITVTAIVDSAFVGFFAMSGQPTLIATAINVALVSIGMLVILMINYRDFTRMIDAQLRTEALSNENLRLANLDSLTDLPNRRAFFAHLAKAFDTAQGSGRPACRRHPRSRRLQARQRSLWPRGGRQAPRRGRAAAASPCARQGTSTCRGSAATNLPWSSRISRPTSISLPSASSCARRFARRSI